MYLGCLGTHSAIIQEYEDMSMCTYSCNAREQVHFPEQLMWHPLVVL